MCIQKKVGGLNGSCLIYISPPQSSCKFLPFLGIFDLFLDPKWGRVGQMGPDLSVQDPESYTQHDPYLILNILPFLRGSEII